MPDDGPKTYKDSMIDESSRELYMLALKQLKGMLTDDSTWRSERAEILANICNAVSCGFSPEEDENDLK
jgi:hypothetical protein